MTNEKRKLTGLAMVAHTEGKPVQILDHGSVWLDVSMPTWVAHQPYRPKPEPRVRDWTAADVPPLCWIRNGQCDNCPSMIVGIDDCGVRIIWHSNAESRCCFHHVSFKRLAEAWDYSIDLKSWKECKATEDAQ